MFQIKTLFSFRLLILLFASLIIRLCLSTDITNRSLGYQLLEDSCLSVSSTSGIPSRLTPYLFVLCLYSLYNKIGIVYTRDSLRMSPMAYQRISTLLERWQLSNVYRLLVDRRSINPTSTINLHFQLLDSQTFPTAHVLD